jgi:hypothetical protein
MDTQRRSIILVSVIIIFLLAVTGSSIWLARSGQLSSIFPSPTPTPSVTTTVTPTPTTYPTGSPTPTPTQIQTSDITVSSLTEHQTISSPLTITGQAKGSWYFEASFPIKVLDSKGNILGQGQGKAQGSWMTDAFVPFTATITFTKPITTDGEIVLANDNPSGKPENAKELRIPVRF